MKVGDLVQHVKTPAEMPPALVVQLWDEGHNRGIVQVMFKGELRRWFRSSVKVIDESR